jgi:hypothetical protein
MTDQPKLFEGYLTEEQYLAERKIGRRQGQRERAAGIAPPWVKIGRRVFYSIPGGQRYVASQEVEPVRRPQQRAGRPRRDAPELRR